MDKGGEVAMHMVDQRILKRWAILLLVSGSSVLVHAQSAARDWPWDDPNAAAAGAEAEMPADEAMPAADGNDADMSMGWASPQDAPPAEPSAEEGSEAGLSPNDPSPGEPWSLQENEQDLSLIQSGPEEGPDLASPSVSMEGVRDNGSQRQRPGATPGINVGAYEELLRENVSLRRQIGELEQGGQDSLTDKQRMEGELREMERQLADSVTTIQQLRQGGTPPSDADAAELALLRADKERLTAEAEALRTQLKAQPQGSAVAGVSPAAGSALYRALEEENARLKQQLQGQAQAVSEDALEREAKLASQLDQANTEKAQLQAAIDKLVERVPAMEKELAELRDSVGTKDRDLQTKERDMESLRLEMEKREQRLIKAERMNALLEKTRSEVEQVSKKEQRDLHYNMAAVYSKEGRFREAEQAYLHALRVDPTDAGSHYNLGILYEDVLGDKRKAAMHYRAYLKLAPNADDVDEVKSWLLQLDMN